MRDRRTGSIPDFFCFFGGGEGRAAKRTQFPGNGWECGTRRTGSIRHFFCFLEAARADCETNPISREWLEGRDSRTGSIRHFFCFLGVGDGADCETNPISRERLGVGDSGTGSIRHFFCFFWEAAIGGGLRNEANFPGAVGSAGQRNGIDSRFFLLFWESGWGGLRNEANFPECLEVRDRRTGSISPVIRFFGRARERSGTRPRPATQEN